MTVPAFSVIIPVFNKWELTAACLRSLAGHTPDLDYEVIVADNGSADDTAVELEPLGRELFRSRFTRLRFDANRNFGPACNAGAGLASAPLLLFLNNDTLMTPGWAPPLLAALDALPRPGAAGPLLLYEHGTVQHMGVVFSAQGVGHLYRDFPADHPVVRRRRRLQALTAAALLMPKDLFLDCGGFYEEYRNGFEDVDLCAQILRRDRSFTLAPDSVIYHLESQTPGRVDKEQEGHNVGLLQKRAADAFYTDAHLHGLLDGFVPFVNDMMEIGLLLPTEEEEALNASLRETDIALCYEQIRKNPYWVGGRRWLAAFMEKRGKLSEALILHLQLAEILSTKAAFQEAMRLAARAGRTQSLALLGDYLQKTVMVRLKEDLARRMCSRALRRSRDSADPLIARLYEEKLREFGFAVS